MYYGGKAVIIFCGKNIGTEKNRVASRSFMCYNQLCSSKKTQGVNCFGYKSALKRVGVSEKKNLRNRMITSQVKTAVKSFDKALASEDKAAVESAYVNAVSTVDKAAGKGVIHKNAANRKKAQLAIKLAAK